MELAPRENEGLLVELTAVAVEPAKPFVLDVLNVPFRISDLTVVPKEITDVPASIVAPLATVMVCEAGEVILKFPVENVPELTVIFPVTLVGVIAASNVFVPLPLIINVL